MATHSQDFASFSPEPPLAADVARAARATSPAGEGAAVPGVVVLELVGRGARHVSWILRRFVGARQPITLDLRMGERTIHFTAPDAFEFTLASRTEVPSAQIARLAEQPPHALERSAARLRGVERRIAQLVARSIDEPDSLTRALADFDLDAFSRDHQWRDLFARLRETGPRHDPYKRIALVRYLRYLGARYDLLRNLSGRRAAGAAGAARPDPGFD